MNSSHFFYASVRSVSRRTWVLLVALLLGGLLLLDNYYPTYVEQLEQLEGVQHREERVRAMVELLPRFQQKLADEEGSYQFAVAQSFVNSDASESVEQFREMVRAFLRDSRITDGSVPVVDQQLQGEAVALTLVTQFTCIPRQLAELERQLLAAPKRIQATALDVEVVSDPLSGGQQLKVTLTLTAIHTTSVAFSQK